MSVSARVRWARAPLRRSRGQRHDPQGTATPGQRRFRTVVDKMGMGDHMEGYNDQLEQILAGIYGAFGIGDMLKLSQ